MRVSVVVPVYRPGDEFDDLIRSLDQQALDPQDFEVLLCDDGSGEPTVSRLAAVVAARPHMRVLQLGHTGWPGTPRNHGIDAARGRYVFFVDQDDRLPPGSLRSLADFADRHSSDVVVGREIGEGRRIPRAVFRRDIPNAVLGENPLLEMLTPHKLFRTAFLHEHGIRFPDGRVRLEDHLFVMAAYFAATTISILASEPCYVWVKRSGSASSSRIDPASYFPHLETVLDLVEANTVPGPMRDALLRHWYRGKVLKRLEGRRMLRYPAAYRENLLDHVIPLARRRFGPSVEEGLDFPLRVRSALLRSGRREELRRLAAFDAALGLEATVRTVGWTNRAKLLLTLDLRIAVDGRDAPRFERSTSPDGAAHALWQAEDVLGADSLAPDQRDAAHDLTRNRIEIIFQDSATGTETRIGGRLRGTTATVVIDPLRVFDSAGRSPGGSLVAEVRYAGWTLRAPLRVEHAVLEDAGRSPLLAGRRCELVLGDGDALELRRDLGGGRIRDWSARTVQRSIRRVRTLRTTRARSPRR
ncbi:glycosyltransferase family A protein [Planococcus sp. APC 4015]|nr:glycosyltransferase family A protein [Planococcus sp. APC 4015]